eukprot:548524_1
MMIHCYYHILEKKKKLIETEKKNSNIKSTKAKLDEPCLCCICIDKKLLNAKSIPQGDMPHHIMKHVVNGEVAICIEDINSNFMLYLCFFCGKHSKTQCNVFVERESGGSCIITTSCIVGYLSNKYYTKLLMRSEKNAWSNAPNLCTVSGCIKDIWDWNKAAHLEHRHQISNVAASISEFERKCVEYQSIGGHIPDKKLSELLTNYKTETSSLFVKKLKALKDRKDKKAKNKRTTILKHHQKKTRRLQRNTILLTQNNKRNKEEKSDTDDDENFKMRNHNRNRTRRAISSSSSDDNDDELP